MGRIGKKIKMKAFRRWLRQFNASKHKHKVFDNFQRTDTSPKKNRETDFGFYNQSARPEMAHVRDIIEKCVSNYPRDECNEIIARLRSGDDFHFRSATFELFIHEALWRLGFELIPHPELPNGNTSKPDFLVRDREGHAFYLEAVLATEDNELDKKGELRKGTVMDAISAPPHANFMIAIDDEGSPESPPPGKKLKIKIHRWLDSLDPDEIARCIDANGPDSIPPLNWEHDGWSVQIRPIPLPAHLRGKSTTLIGIGGTSAGWVDGWSPIRDAVKFKGGKYGELDKPLVVAVNIDSFHLDRIDEMQALFGQEKVVIKVGSDEEPEVRRKPNGAWLGKGGPQFTRVSAAWLFNDLHVSSLAVGRCTVYFNPWANIPAPASLRHFPHAIADSGEVTWNEGLSIGEILELHKGWPERA